MLSVEDLSLAARLSGVSASLYPGQVTAICGPNGAGKSTLLASLAGLLAPDEGRVALGGEALLAMPSQARAQAIGYLPQTPEVAWDVSVEVLVSLGRIPWAGVPAGEAQDAIDAAIAAMDLDEFRHRPVSRLSGGERARALMARVLATRPRWLLADEPLANLDLGHAAALIARFREQAAAGRGVVLVLHDLANAMNHADRVLVLDRGSLVADGPPREALAEDVIARVWGVRANWLGEEGGLALSHPPC
ncbi:MAG: ABC transporter ATP-binding protein [Novosphingobium sp.]|nr:ABC transporter ATP-binding protein [Novosphingobium sp.]